MDRSPPLERLVYRSRAVGSPTTELDLILRVSVWNNARRRITGVLGHVRGHYVQLLEGPGAALDDLMAVLERDPRHRELTVLERRPMDQRLFPGWSMARGELFSDRTNSDVLMGSAEIFATRLADLVRRGETVVS